MRVIHKIDPRIRCIVAFGLSIIVALSSNLEAIAIASCFVLLMFFTSGIPFKKTVKRLLVVNWFIAFLWPFVYFSHSGGLMKVILITVKCNTIVLLVLTLVSSMEITTMGQALHKLGLNKKLVHMLFFSYRYLYVLKAEYKRLLASIKIRGFRPKTNMHTYKTYAYLFAMILVRSWERSQRIYQAMLCRGFKGQFYSLYSFRMQLKDLLFIFTAMVLATVMVWVELNGK